MPAALAGLDDPLTLLDKGPRGMVDGPTIGVQERLQLADGDVPFFQMDATGKVYDGAGHHVGQASFTDRFSLPSSRLADFTSIVRMAGINSAIGENPCTKTGAKIQINKRVKLPGYTVQTLANGRHGSIVFQCHRQAALRVKFSHYIDIFPAVKRSRPDR